MSTYNVYDNSTAQVGGHVPIWLGKVRPIPVGGTLAAAYAVAGAFYPAGTPMELKDGIATPFKGFKVKAYATSSTNSIITVVPLLEGDAPKTSDFLQKVGANFDATGKAWNPDSIAVNETDPAAYDITVATASIDVVAEGDFLAFSSATAEGSSKSLAAKPNYYLYNDVAIDPTAIGVSKDSIQASVALVNFHGEGLLINRTPAAAVAAQMKVAVPNVIQETRF